MSTPDAAPVEVEGEAVPLAEDLDLPVHWSVMEKVAYRSGWADCRLRALRALPAAPTTPDIADERVRALIDTWQDRAFYTGNTATEMTYQQCAADLLAALATPSTPGAGQAGEGDARKWRCLGPGGSLGNKCTPDNPHASWRFNGCGWTPEPATGQGEPS